MATTKQSSDTSPIVWALAISSSIIVGLIFLKPYLAVTILGLLMAFVFYPVYDKLSKKFKSESMAAWLTTLVSVLIVGIPALIVLTITARQALYLVEDISNNGVSFVEGENINQAIANLTFEVNQKIESLVGVSEAIKTDNVSSFVESTIPNVLKTISNSIVGIISGIPTFFTLLIIYFFVFVSGLVNGKKTRKIIKQISPFDNKTNNLYLERLGLMAKAMVKGQFLIAATQGIVSATVLSMFGFADYFLFLAVGLTFISFIPLGAGIVTIPIGILLILLGNVFGGVIILLNHFLVITNIDNYIRPKVVPDNARLPAALTILGAFAGVSYFGFLGVIYGPMIMIFIVTTIESYVLYKERLNKS